MKFTSLNKKNHFDNLKKEELCIASKGLKVFVKENGTTSSRLGISISSKHANAVNRNKFKRRTREAVRSLSDNKNLDILVVGNKDSSNLTSSEILKIFKSHPLL
ncbi:ribonuclease P protein component [Acidimicrobiaceae bacterium]|nr:ribonuclease P protein component [Acidimicrobiaceae bacterium]